MHAARAKRSPITVHTLRQRHFFGHNLRWYDPSDPEVTGLVRPQTFPDQTAVTQALESAMLYRDWSESAIWGVFGNTSGHSAGAVNTLDWLGSHCKPSRTLTDVWAWVD